GSVRPTAIIGTAIVATTVSTVVGIVSVKFLEKLRWFRLPVPPPEAEPASEAPGDEIAATTPETILPPLSPAAKALLIAFGLFFLWLFFTMTFSANRLKPGSIRAVLCERGARGAVVEGVIVSETASNVTLRSSNGVTTTIAKQHPATCS